MTVAEDFSREIDGFLALVRVVARFADGCGGVTQPAHVAVWRQLVEHAAQTFAARVGRLLSETYCDDGAPRRAMLYCAGVVEAQSARIDAACERWPGAGVGEGTLPQVLVAAIVHVEHAAAPIATRAANDRATRHER